MATNQNYKFLEQEHVQLLEYVFVEAQHDVLGILTGQMLLRDLVNSKLDDMLKEFDREVSTQSHLMLSGS